MLNSLIFLVLVEFLTTTALASGFMVVFSPALFEVQEEKKSPAIKIETMYFIEGILNKLTIWLNLFINNKKVEIVLALRI